MNTAVANVQQLDARRSVTVAMAERYGMEAPAFEATLRATVVPKEISREQFAAFLLVCKQYNLNPILKEIYAFPTRSGGIQPIVGVDGWANLINSHPQCDGIVFEDTRDGDNLAAITCKIYRKDRQHPTTCTEYMAECKRATDTWKQWPRRMLRHKALIQAARYAFGFSGIVEPDEWERSPENPDATKVKAKATVVQAPASGETKALPPVVGETSEGMLGIPKRLPPADSAALLKALTQKLVRCNTLPAIDKWKADTAEGYGSLTNEDRVTLEDSEDFRRSQLTEPTEATTTAEPEMAEAD